MVIPSEKLELSPFAVAVGLSLVWAWVAGLVVAALAQLAIGG